MYHGVITFALEYAFRGLRYRALVSGLQFTALLSVSFRDIGSQLLFHTFCSMYIFFSGFVVHIVRFHFLSERLLNINSRHRIQVCCLRKCVSERPTHSFC